MPTIDVPRCMCSTVHVTAAHIANWVVTRRSAAHIANWVVTGRSDAFRSVDSSAVSPDDTPVARRNCANAGR